MMDPTRLIFIHGLNGSSQGVKANLLRALYPQMSIPDFPGSLEERMDKLAAILSNGIGWTLVGSSFGGLMAALYACRYPDRIRRQILLAPALIWPDFASDPPDPIDVPTVIFHGRKDSLIPLSAVRPLAQQVFNHLTFNEVEDDHGLYETVIALDWAALLEG